jgi:hypothetical protein
MSKADFDFSPDPEAVARLLDGFMTLFEGEDAGNGLAAAAIIVSEVLCSVDSERQSMALYTSTIETIAKVVAYRIDIGSCAWQMTKQ